MNHASPEVLTRMARNLYILEPTLESITSTKDMTCRACMQGKMTCAPHRRTQHNYDLGEAFSTDIMGPIQLPAVTSEVKRYFLSFIDTHSRYAYVATISRRKEAGK